MNRHLLVPILADLETWAPALVEGARETAARRIAEQLERGRGRAEFRFGAGSSLSWLFDARSGQLLATYPDGVNRIRAVAPPLTAGEPHCKI